MSNIYLKVIIETFSKLRFSGFKKFVHFKTSSCNLKIRDLEQNCVWPFDYFDFERNYDLLKSKSLRILLKKSINFNKSKQDGKWKTSHTVLKIRTLCFSSHKNRKLKVNLWQVGAHERIKKAIFVPLIFSKMIFFKICILCQFTVNWIHFQNIHTFTYQKTLLHKLLLLVFKFVEIL